MPNSIKRWSLDKTAGRLFEHGHGKFVRYLDHAAEVARLEARVAELTAEVTLDDARIAGLEAVVRAVPACPAHGDQCLPHAVAWIEERK